MFSSLGDSSAALFQLAAVSITAQPFVESGFLSSLTNSIFVALVVMAVIYLVVRAGTRRASLIPGPVQNLSLIHI